jgi:hypothetical protein
MDIDKNIVDLVDSLNAFPGIFTFSSCGGHEHSTVTSPLGQFYVNFEVDPLRGRMAVAATDFSRCRNATGELTITVWQSGDEPETISFRLNGSEGADPDELAGALENALDWFNSNPPFVLDETDDDDLEAT